MDVKAEENKKRIEKVRRGRFMSAAAGASGDAAVTCGLPDGSLAFILSDGMGKGMKAAAESEAVVRKLRRLLKSGVPAAKAIKDVNVKLLAGCGGEETFATVDLALLDMESGTVRFYKMGAATSFVVRGGRVRRVAQPALPVGILPRLHMSRTVAMLRSGDMLVMVTDGVTEADRNDPSANWLEEYLAERAEGAGPRATAEKIVAEAARRYGSRETDDLTALVVMVE